MRFEPGALISYWDTSYSDNNVGDHPGGGQILPVDAHPNFVHSGTSLMRTKVQTFDSAFSLNPTTRQTFHLNGVPTTVRPESAQPVFNDAKTYWFDSDEHGSGDHPGFYEPEWMGVDVPHTGTKIRILKVGKTGVMTVKVADRQLIHPVAGPRRSSGIDGVRRISGGGGLRSATVDASFLDLLYDEAPRASFDEVVAAAERDGASRRGASPSCVAQYDVALRLRELIDAPALPGGRAAAPSTTRPAT